MYFFYKLIFLCSLATRFQGISSPSSLRKFRKFPLLGQIQLYFFVRIHAYAAFLSIYARPYTSPRGSARLQHLQKKASPAFVPERNLSTELKRAKLLTHTQRVVAHYIHNASAKLLFHIHASRSYHLSVGKNISRIVSGAQVLRYGNIKSNPGFLSGIFNGLSG